jgi:hypothetical protein
MPPYGKIRRQLQRRKPMNQSEVVFDMRRSGWELDTVRGDGFVHLYKRDRERNCIYPDYTDVTVFPNGRVAEDEFNKYPKKGAGLWAPRS